MDHTNALTPDDLGLRSKLLVDKHAAYISSFSNIWEGQDKLEHVATEHFWMSGMYWGLTAMAILGRLQDMDTQRVVDWIRGWQLSVRRTSAHTRLDRVMSCYHPEDGGFGASPRNDSHMLSTLSALQILALVDELHRVDADAVVAYIAGLQHHDGAFAGDKWGEIDTRFTYCALLSCSILGRLDAINVSTAVDFVIACKNFDGGFGCTPGNESHAGQVFTCIGALSLAGRLDAADKDLVAWWLCERQTRSGGLNGRPEKLQDVCYSWWCLSCLAILGRLHWIDQEALSKFILYCQDEDDGGISDRPDDMADVYHTFFGIAGLSLMGYEGLGAIDPTYALPVETVKRLKSHQQMSHQQQKGEEQQPQQQQQQQLELTALSST